MTDPELLALIEGITPIVRQQIAAAVGDLVSRVAVAEARLAVLGDVRDRTIVLETKLAAPATPAVLAAPGPPDGDLASVLEALQPLHGDIAKDITTLRERLTVVELRGALPGPAGPAGKDGAPGRDGRDGHDGIALDDLSLTQQDERTVIVRARIGGQIKDIGTATFPVEIYRGVYVDGRTYAHGDCVTFAGSEFHCNQDTTGKPEQSKDWTLKVKRGRDGKDGKDAPGPAPVVRAGA